MATKIAFVTPPDAEYGFSLTGVSQSVTSNAETEDMLRKTMDETDNGLVIIDERLLMPGRDSKEGLTEERLRDIENHWQGILLVLPSPEKPPAETEDYAARLIRRAIGYHVRLKL